MDLQYYAAHLHKKEACAPLALSTDPRAWGTRTSRRPVRLLKGKLANAGAGTLASLGSGGGLGTCSGCPACCSLLTLGWGGSWLGCWGVGLGSCLRGGRLSGGSGLGSSLGGSLWCSLDRGGLGVWGGSSLGWGTLPQPVAFGNKQQQVKPVNATTQVR
jgi:hypothetical protein